VFTIPNPSGAPAGSWDTPQCRSLTIGQEGLVWFTDPGTESVGRLQVGTVTEYPLPLLPVEAEGYPSDQDRYPTPEAITAEGSILWVASASGKGIYSVNPTATAARVATHATRSRNRHRRRRR
jgi:streptogramin lyase